MNFFNLFKGMGITDYVLILLNIVYPFVFGFVILPIFTESIYLAIVSLVMLIGFPMYAFIWWKNGNKGK